MGLAYSDIADAVNLTQETYIKRGSWLDLTSDLQDHVAVRELWEKRASAFADGDDWRFTIQFDHNHSYKAVEMYETDSSVMVDTTTEGYMGPRHVNAHYIYDQRHPAFQRGAAKIVDFVKVKYTEMMVSFWEGLEADLWTCPDAANTKSIHGIPYWIVKCAAGEEGFYGDDPTGYEAIGRAHVLSTAQARWRNYAADYAAVSKEDLVRKMRVGSRKIKFRSPISHAEPDLGAMRNGIYCNCDTITLIEEELEKQNMDLGNDIASKDGRALFKGSPFIYVPYLDADTSDPVYMIDWKWMGLGTLPGWEKNITKPYMVPGMHLVERVDLDASMELCCTNLRRQAVFAKI
jgi:hypothetical protein